MIGSFNLRGCWNCHPPSTRLSRGESELTDNRIAGAGPPVASSVDEPYLGLPAPLNDLQVTVLAPAVALSREDGQIRAAGMDGLFVSDSRALTEVRLRFGGTEPHLLAALQDVPGRIRFIGVAHGFGDQINDPTIRIDRVRQVAPDGMGEQIRITSAATRPVRTWVTIDLRCDLTPLDVAKTGRSNPDLPAR